MDNKRLSGYNEAVFESGLKVSCLLGIRMPPKAPCSASALHLRTARPVTNSYTCCSSELRVTHSHWNKVYV